MPIMAHLLVDRGTCGRTRPTVCRSIALISSLMPPVTRTMPVGNGGKFTQESREIYELVREMQTVRGLAPYYLSGPAWQCPLQASFEAIRPGLHWDVVQLLCHNTLVRGFKRLGIFRADADEVVVLAAGVSAAFFPHGAGHSLELDVHDMPSASKPAHNPTIAQGNGSGVWPGHEKLYEYLRLRLPLEVAGLWYVFFRSGGWAL
jgi:Xaa-Pro dipeptidase